MRNHRRLALGAGLVVAIVIATACSSGGGSGSSATPSGSAGGATIASQLTLGGPPECPQRPYCAIGLKDTYGVTFGSFKPLDTGGPLTVAALKSGTIDVALLFSTSSVIAANNWVVLKDDKHLQQADNIVPVVRTDVLNDEISTLLNKVSGSLTDENITPLNAKVELDKEDPADVAQGFLQEQNLLPTSGNGAGTTVTVGVSSAFAENQIVAEMYAQMLEAAGYTVKRQLDLGTREISDKALDSGAIDIKPEYLGSELKARDPSNPGSGDPTSEEADLKPLLAAKGITLLDFSQANDTNSFVTTSEIAQQYGLVNVSDLAKPAPSS
jgi:glycine betaine/choline ABC-type transport system substrate-binding protein